MGTDAQESGALICRCSWKPLFHCQAQLVSNKASRPWQRGFPSSPDHTEEREARREGPKAAPPGASPFLSLPEAVTTESEGRKDTKRQLGVHLSLFLPVLYLLLCKPEATTTAGGSGLAVPSPLAACCHPDPRPGGKTDTAKPFAQGAPRLQRRPPHFSPPTQQNVAPIPPPRPFLGQCQRQLSL